MSASRSTDTSHKPPIPCATQQLDTLTSLHLPPHPSKQTNAITVRCVQLPHPIRFIDHPEFHQPDAWVRFIEAPESQLPSPLPVSKRPSGTFRNLITYPSPTHEQTKRLFLRMNFLKSSAARLVEGAMEQPLSQEHLLQATEYLKLAKETKDVLVASNMRLAIKVANRFSRASHIIDDLVSIGCETLMRACETYDGSRPFSFYTYGMRALFSNYSRFMKERNSQAMAHLHDVTFQDPVDQRTDPNQQHAHNQLLAAAIGDMFTQLSERERLAIEMRALDEATFLEIGNKLGISKQGAQGVVNRALSALQRRAGVEPRDNLL